jgi:anti-sigma regulatory factor (Ser/Thr protein kinase)
MEAVILPGVLDSLKTIRDYLKAAAEAAGLDKKASYNLRLAVDEIATNAILYGYEGGSQEKTLKLWGEIDEETLAVFLEDEGAPYDPRQAPPPVDPTTPLEERRGGGWGVHLAIKGVDEFDYERVNDRNRTKFVVRRRERTAEA